MRQRIGSSNYENYVVFPLNWLVCISWRIFKQLEFSHMLWRHTFITFFDYRLRYAVLNLCINLCIYVMRRSCGCPCPLCQSPRFFHSHQWSVWQDLWIWSRLLHSKPLEDRTPVFYGHLPRRWSVRSTTKNLNA